MSMVAGLLTSIVVPAMRTLLRLPEACQTLIPASFSMYFFACRSFSAFQRRLLTAYLCDSSASNGSERSGHFYQRAYSFRILNHPTPKAASRSSHSHSRRHTVHFPEGAALQT